MDIQAIAGTAARNSDLVRAVEACIPEIAARSKACEASRMVPVENMQALAKAGFLGGFKPARYGGGEHSPVEMLEAAALIAGVCPSTAWVAQLLAVHSHAIAYYDPRLQDEIWGVDQDALICSSVAPMGKAERVDGGFSFSGRFGWSSGCDHAQWALLGALIDGPEAGQRVNALFAIPRRDFEIVDTWFSSALKGTGSKDIVVENIFVPDYRVETMMSLTFGQARGYRSHAAEIYRLPFSSIFASGFSAVAVGIARSALQLYTKRLSDRVRAYTGAKVAASPPAYMHLAQSYQEVMAAAALLRDQWWSFVDAGRSEAPPTFDQLIDWRTTQAYATQLAVSAVDRLFSASGGGAILDASGLQRCFRDVHGAAAHAYSDYDVSKQILGRFLIGIEPDPTLL